MKKVLIFIVSLISLHLHAQILDNSQGSLFSDQAFFNQKFIQRNRVKSVSSEISFKRELDIIRKQKSREEYEFDKSGRLQRQITIFPSANSVLDTSMINYFYDKNDNIYLKRMTDPNGFFSYSFTFDENKRPSSMTYKRLENKGKTRFDFVEGSTFVIFSESYTHKEYNPEQIEKTVINDNGIPYMEILYLYNKHKQLLSETSRFIATGRRSSETTYTYDERFRLVEKVETAFIPSESKVTHSYSYDDLGNILEEKIYKKEKLHSNIQFLYQKETMLLDAKLIKDEETGIIKIYQYSYTFFE